MCWTGCIKKHVVNHYLVGQPQRPKTLPSCGCCGIFHSVQFSNTTSQLGVVTITKEHTQLWLCLKLQDFNFSALRGQCRKCVWSLKYLYVDFYEKSPSQTNNLYQCNPDACIIVDVFLNKIDNNAITSFSSVDCIMEYFSIENVALRRSYKLH